MAREPRAPRPKLDLPGQRPLLQGHLRRGGQRPSDVKPPITEEAPATTAPESAKAAAGPTAQPATEVASTPGDAARGKATRSPAEVATRRHLEGSEQGPS